MKTRPKVGDYVKVKGSYIAQGHRKYSYGIVNRRDGAYIYVEFRCDDDECDVEACLANAGKFVAELYTNELEESSEEEYFFDVM